ncbi:D-arabinono-1,4-lactone oxidase [Janthinobacterium fluminis]|uniref:D-arabinono-1,4-lactone oxidase n=1 Tax=Janthinobacterium fluminis TaxID=2987524 RepID=A0ABT5KAD8_9BURK|nr:D-arabinono-1,4-lactone oxidase [Janthinobacterium fluminis]MDC8760797.1 D-arabinono-1,4-lactone oxidase [Janthinobacterium fluminis]
MSAPRPGRRQFLKMGGGLAIAAAGAAANTAAAPPPAAAPGGGAGIVWSNWSGSQSCRAQALATPASSADIQQLLANGKGGVRCVGAGHSFSALIPGGDTLISLDRMAGLLGHGGTGATLLAGTRLAQASRQLDALGLAFRNLPDIDAQSLAGAVSTATHGTGAELPAMHADIEALQLVTANGRIRDFDAVRHPDYLAAARVSLGSLGVLTQLRMQLVPSYRLQRKVVLKPVGQMLELAPALARAHRHFEFYYLPFTGYAAAITHDLTSDQSVLPASSADEDMLGDLRRLRDWAGRFPQLRRWLAAKFIDANLSEQARDRSWKLLSTQRPSKFNESECHVPRERGIACVREVIAKLEQRNEVFFPLEFRFVKGDSAWLSPFYERDSCSIAVHAAHGEAYAYLVAELAPIFRRYDGRPHWGKLHGHTAAELARLYPRWNDFLAVRRELDPGGRMLNAHLRGLFGIKA